MPPITTTPHEEKEADRRERDRANDLRSLLAPDLCQMCGNEPNTGEQRREELCPYCNEEQNMFDYYTQAAERANGIPDSDEPLDMTVARLRDIIELQAREIARLQAVIHRLEQSPVGYVYDRNDNILRAGGR